MPYRITWAITTATTAATALEPVWIRVRGGFPRKGGAPYSEDCALAGGAVVVGGDAPVAVAPDQHPGRAHQSLARDSVLPGEDDPVLADHDGRVAGKRADVHRAGGHPRPVERARERRRPYSCGSPDGPSRRRRAGSRWRPRYSRPRTFRRRRLPTPGTSALARQERPAGRRRTLPWRSCWSSVSSSLSAWWRAPPGGRTDGPARRGHPRGAKPEKI